MKLSNVKAFARIAKNTIVKHAPEILMGLGGVTFVATVVVASKETIDEQEILENHQEELYDIETYHAIGQLDKKAYNKSRMNVYAHTSVETVKNYIPAIGLGAASLTCFFGAFGIMKKRYATLAVAYTALEKSFRAYRQRVIEDKGSDADLYYLTGAKPKEITVKDEEGNKTKIKTLVLPDGTIASPYAFKFGKYKENGDRNKQWTEDQSLNLSYLLGQMDYLNKMLYERCLFDDHGRVVVKGSVMLNEIRDLCGEDPSPTGAVVGNLFGNGEKGSNGYIEFQIVEATEKDPDTGRDIPCVFIDPNCDGLIYDRLGEVEDKPFIPSYSEWGEDVTV